MGIVTGSLLARRQGFKSFEELIAKRSADYAAAGKLETPFTGKQAGGKHAKHIDARIDYGRWIADCPFCNGAEYVDPDYPLFYCFSCGNSKVDGDGLKVKFPGNRHEIETEVMARPVDEPPKGDELRRAFLAKPVYPGLARSWHPSETVADLREQNRGARHFAMQALPTDDQIDRLRKIKKVLATKKR